MTIEGSTIKRTITAGVLLSLACWVLALLIGAGAIAFLIILSLG